jgi:hypothetical protein
MISSVIEDRGICSDTAESRYGFRDAGLEKPGLENPGLENRGPEAGNPQAFASDDSMTDADEEPYGLRCARGVTVGLLLEAAAALVLYAAWQAMHWR